MKVLFAESRQSHESRRLMKPLRKGGIAIGRHRVRKLMEKLGLTVKCKKRFTLTIDSNHQLSDAENFLKGVSHRVLKIKFGLCRPGCT
ncbi:IS3 family transposase [Microbulbifer echini]|uniref:IS3 family transposase n=1 Tax=Microbulbifer echini TaxID=1529067 RepID=A0ABV4NPT6_9GAMM